MIKLKDLLSWCWKQIKKPLIQFVCILVLVAGYWTWDITFVHDDGEFQAQIRVIEDSTAVADRFDELREHRYVLPRSMEEESSDSISDDSGRGPAADSLFIPDDIDDMSDREYRLYLWDIILGHLSSILGSLAALCTPIITWWFQRKSKK